MTQPSSIAGSAKAKVVLLAGFLGAGKTTLLKRILSWEGDLSDTVVLVNEFGDVGIDGALLQQAGSDVIELTSGCICCTLAADLIQSLKGIAERFNPKRIMIEATGVADPTSITAVLDQPFIRDVMEHQSTLTVLGRRFLGGEGKLRAAVLSSVERGGSDSSQQDRLARTGTGPRVPKGDS